MFGVLGAALLVFLGERLFQAHGVLDLVQLLRGLTLDVGAKGFRMAIRELRGAFGDGRLALLPAHLVEHVETLCRLERLLLAGLDLLRGLVGLAILDHLGQLVVTFLLPAFVSGHAAVGDEFLRPCLGRLVLFSEDVAVGLLVAADHRVETVGPLLGLRLHGLGCLDLLGLRVLHQLSGEFLVGPQVVEAVPRHGVVQFPAAAIVLDLRPEFLGGAEIVIAVLLECAV